MPLLSLLGVAPAAHAAALLAASSTSKGSSNPLGLLLPILVLGAVFFLFTRNSRRKQAAAGGQLSTDLAPGVEVMTTGGLYARVRHIDDDGVYLEVAPGVVSRYDRRAISRILVPESGEAAEELEPGDPRLELPRPGPQIGEPPAGDRDRVDLEKRDDERRDGEDRPKPGA